MKKYVYPVILFDVNEGKNYTVLFPDLDIIASGETVEDAYVEAEEYLQTYLEFAEKMKSTIPSPTSYLDTEKLNPKRIVLLADAETKGETTLTNEEQSYKNFLQQYLVDSSEE